jgi:hypothetical protein
MANKGSQKNLGATDAGLKPGDYANRGRLPSPCSNPGGQLRAQDACFGLEGLEKPLTRTKDALARCHRPEPSLCRCFVSAAEKQQASSTLARRTQ